MVNKNNARELMGPEGGDNNIAGRLLPLRLL
jgi:hypothetical protein